MISIIPLWLKATIIVIALASYTAYVHRYATIAERSSWKNKLAESERLARTTEQKLQLAVDTGAKAYEKLKQENLLSINAAHIAGDGLRYAINKYGSESTKATGNTDAARIGELFAECSTKYTGMAEEADRLAIKVTGLQGYANSVTP